MTIVEFPLSGHLKCRQSVLATDLKHLEFTNSTSSLPSTHLVMKQQNISCLVRVGHSVKANALGAPPSPTVFSISTNTRSTKSYKQNHSVNVPSTTKVSAICNDRRPPPDPALLPSPPPLPKT